MLSKSIAQDTYFEPIPHQCLCTSLQHPLRELKTRYMRVFPPISFSRLITSHTHPVRLFALPAIFRKHCQGVYRERASVCVRSSSSPDIELSSYSP